MILFLKWGKWLSTVGFRRMQIHGHSIYNNNNVEIASDGEASNEKVNA